MHRKGTFNSASQIFPTDAGKESVGEKECGGEVTGETGQGVLSFPALLWSQESDQGFTIR